MACCTFVDSGSRGVKQSCGAFAGVVEPGCACYFVPCQEITAISLRVIQLPVSTETKTKDNVTVKVLCSVQYHVREDRVFDAYFKLNNVKQQMSAIVDDEVRSTLPRLDLDDAYSQKTEMAHSVLETLQREMEEYGLAFDSVLITDLAPDEKVVAAMNDINFQKRMRAAMQEKAEGDKILKVADAQAESEAKYLSGKGVAEMRMAITNGAKTSIEDMQKEVGLEAADVVHMMMVTQYLDTLKDFAASGKGSVMMPSSKGNTEESVRNGFMTASLLP